MATGARELEEKRAEQLFMHNDFALEVGEFQYIGRDKDFAYARVRTRSNVLTGPAPLGRNTESDMLFVFHPHSTGWKLWTGTRLTFRVLE